MLHHLLLGILDAQPGNPLAERSLVGVLDVGREVGAIGAQLKGQVADSQLRAGISLTPDPGGEASFYLLTIRLRAQRHSILNGDRFANIFGWFLLQDAFHLFVEKQVVDIGVKQINVKRYGREHPQEQIPVGQEREQPATDPIDDCPPGKDGHPADIGRDILGVRVVEQAHRPSVGTDKPAGQPKPIGQQPQSQEHQPNLLHGPRRHGYEKESRKSGKQRPVAHVPPEASAGQVKAVEQGGKCRTEQPIGHEIGGEVHQDSFLMVKRPKSAKEVYRVVGTQHQQSRTHDAARTQIVDEYGLVGSLAHQKIEGKKQHQHQGYAQ